MSDLLRLLHHVGQIADGMFRQHGGSELTARQYVLLEAVAALDAPSQTALVDATGIDRSTIADMVGRLMQRGLLERRRSRRDARSYEVRLTRDGVSALSKGRQAAAATERALLILVRASHQGAFVRALEAIEDGVSEPGAKEAA